MNTFDYEDEFYDENDCDWNEDEVIDRISNGEESEVILCRNHKIESGSGDYICDDDDEEQEDLIERYK